LGGLWTWLPEPSLTAGLARWVDVSHAFCEALWSGARRWCYCLKALLSAASVSPTEALRTV